MIRRGRTLFAAGAACAAVIGSTVDLRSQTGTGRGGEWRDYAGDKGFTKYSPLDQINASNVANLRIAWRRSAVADELKAAQPDLRFGNSFRSTPLMIDGVLYAQNGIGLVEAFDPETGKTIWVQERFEGDQLRGQPSRGIAQWGTNAEARLLTVRGQYLVALEPKTGKIIRSFGSNGRVDLLPAIGPKATGFAMTSSPQVCNDVVIIGNAMSDSPNRKDSLAPGIVQAIDVRTGRVRWTFNPIPRPGEVGSETWEEDSWSYSGAANVWSLISSDEQLGLAYLPTGAPTNDMYGGHRPGDNLFSNSLVCVRCATGERVWHYQLVHHDLWDYDTNVAPILVDIPANGKVVRAVVQLTKQAMAYVFDRATGRPIWPIEERPVPTSKTPGEKTARTQPFPTKPAPFDRHGLDDRRPDRFHARAARGSARDREALRPRTDLHAAVGSRTRPERHQGHAADAWRHRRRGMGRRRIRPGNRHHLRPVDHRHVCRRSAARRSEEHRSALHARRPRAGHRAPRTADHEAALRADRGDRPEVRRSPVERGQRRRSARS